MNIVWLLADHFMWHGHRKYLDLPNMQRVAARGVSFDRAYAVTPQCQPARGAMLTGMFPHRSGMILNNGASGTKAELDDGDPLITDVLLQNGYRCGYFGKWHTGQERIPKDFGLEGWSLHGYGYPYKSERYSAYLAENNLPAPRVRIDRDVENPANEGREFDLMQTPKGWGPFAAGGRLTTPIETHEAFFIADMATKWLEDLEEDRPFFLRMDTWGPHHPYHSAGDFVGKVSPESITEHPSYRQTYENLPLTYEACRRKWSTPDERRDWSYWQPLLARAYEQAMVVDAAFGRVLDALEKLGRLENTMVIVTADHGDLTGSHGDLFNKDSLMVEEVLRIPLCMHVPGQVAGGIRTDALVSTLDLPATVLDAAGLSSDGRDGVSLLPFASGKTPPGFRQDLFCEHHGGFRLEHFQRCIIEKRFKYIAHLDDYDELFDLSEDPYETQNLINDPASAPTLARLRARLATRMHETNDNCPSAIALCSQVSALI